MKQFFIVIVALLTCLFTRPIMTARAQTGLPVMRAVLFYSPTCGHWPEYPDTVNFDELGNLGLNDKDEDALVAFMKTLSDGYEP